MPDKPVVLNNTPLVALYSLGRLDLLRDIYGEVLIPEAVRDEFVAIDSLARHAALEQAPWIKTAVISNPRQALVYIGLDAGEAAVLSLADQLDARLVIIDERKGRRFAKRLGLPLTGTLGVLLLAKQLFLVPAVAPLIEELQRVGLYLAPEIVARTLHLAGEENP